ncbi:outer membrane lipoprotein chaperone LolA [Halomonas sp. BM-2019]|uniref:outer membrane lipoprotein chaperone LolA n=1 Tax=Halomonas sp. BM-2019 TaxID=2811227 RepID=UPI001B3C365B|nr:MAG: outer membrane lipoprotein chaperone LolA [Halomonas sp. BM-2019]
MTVKKTLAAIALFVVAPFAMPLAALASEGAERLTGLLEPLQTYEARFEQQILDGSGERLQEARGQMWLSRPGKFRWEVEAPYLQEVISDGEEVVLHDPDLEQATIQALDHRVTQTFTLLPKDPDTLFEELRMTFRGGALTALHMIDSTGQRTAIEFRDVRTNHAIDDSRFAFEIPEGTDVIRDTH